MRATLGRPDGRAHGWMSDRHRAPIRCQQGGGGAWAWDGVNKDELAGMLLKMD